MGTVAEDDPAIALWERIVQPGVGDLSPEVARVFLQWDFSTQELDRADQLSAKARAGALTEPERRELETYLVLDAFLRIAHAKAERSLGQGSSPS